MIYLIGLGLHDEGDITLKAVKVAKSCDKVYVELYTSPWQGSLKRLEEIIGKKVVMLQRSDLEENSKRIIDESTKENIAILVSGDPLVATTHSSIIVEARKRGIKVDIIHSSSVFSAIAETGLHIYTFGKIATITYPEKNFFPKTPYTTLEENLKSGLHTLLLLDVKADQNRYMSVNEAINLMLELENQEHKKIFTDETKCIGVARLGGDTVIKYGTTKDLKNEDFGKPPHVLIVPGKLHFSEEEYLETL